MKLLDILYIKELKFKLKLIKYKFKANLNTKQIHKQGNYF